MISDDIVLSAHEDRFGKSAEWISRAPGRVNLIGEHVDYNGGFVLPAAIDREIKLAASTNGTGTIRVYSMEYGETFECPTDALPSPGEVEGWRAYLVAVMSLFRKRGADIPSFNAVITGDVPLGAGLSSSAAFSVCVATFLNAVTNMELAGRDIALLAQGAEQSRYVGVQCGIMDQFISALGESGKALLIDCHTLESRLVALEGNTTSILVINSMKRRGLVDSEYNQRRTECAEALRMLSARESTDYPSLRHVSVEIFERHATEMSDKIRRRARHAITENIRVLDFARAAESGEWQGAGDALYASHASLRDDYEVSCTELDFLSQISRKIPGVYGCRMTGAGFGGCAVALINTDLSGSIIEAFRSGFSAKFAVTPDIYKTIPSPGASAHRIAPS
ncbi:MAG: galactokinase [Candidatus Sumerlaeia bacterium]|nr:galactokinase [Candidatus Sumerlaeia bacterium]